MVIRWVMAMVLVLGALAAGCVGGAPHAVTAGALVGLVGALAAGYAMWSESREVGHTRRDAAIMTASAALVGALPFGLVVVAVFAFLRRRPKAAAAVGWVAGRHAPVMVET